MTPASGTRYAGWSGLRQSLQRTTGPRDLGAGVKTVEEQVRSVAEDQAADGNDRELDRKRRDRSEQKDGKKRSERKVPTMGQFAVA